MYTKHTHWDMDHPHGDHVHDPRMSAAFGVILAWSLAWKGVSLWRAAKDGSKPWFVTLLLVNSGGILDALYLFVFSPRRRRQAVDWIEASLPAEDVLTEEPFTD